MKLFLKEFGLWMGIGTLIPLIFLFTIQDGAASDYTLSALIFWIVTLITTIIAITRLKNKHNLVSFGKSFLSGSVYVVLFSIILALFFNATYVPFTYSYSNAATDASRVSVMSLELFLICFFVGIALILYVLLFAGMWYAFKKAGKPGWAIFIPIYNIIVLLEIAKKPMWWFVMFLIPIANIVFAIMTLNGVSKNFGKQEGFTVGLLFLSPIFWTILGYGDAKYVDGVQNISNKNTDDLLDN